MAQKLHDKRVKFYDVEVWTKSETAALEMIMTLQVCEAALDGGRLFGYMGNGRWWKLRRNGRTKLWERDPSRWQIPVKAGLRAYGTISDLTANDLALWRIE
jgi:hypothetical protein